MRSLTFLSVCLLSVLIAAACASLDSGEPRTTSQSTAGLSGSQILAKYCADCHAIGRTDASRHRDAPAFRTLGRRYPIETLGESLAEGIVVGHPDMPEFQFGPEAVASIVSYLQSIQD